MLYKAFAWLLFIAVSPLLWGYGCGNKERDDQWKDYSREAIERIINQQVNMPDSITVFYPDSNSYARLMSSNVKVVFSIDISCGTCLGKFNYWNDFADRIERQ